MPKYDYLWIKKTITVSAGTVSTTFNLYKDIKNVQRNRNAIKELSKICQLNNIDLLIVSIPELRELENYLFPFAVDYIRAIADEENVLFLDLLPALRKYKGNLWVSSTDPHPNSAANKIITNEIYRRMYEIRNYY